MALIHDVAATRLDHRHDSTGDATAGLTVIALLLALVLGFSAADLKAPDAGSISGVQNAQPKLDGRGKWGGYME